MILGLAIQLAVRHPDSDHATMEMRQLLKSGVVFNWLQEHENSFNKTKEMITSDAIVPHFDTTKETFLLTNTSHLHGIGYTLVQIEHNRNYVLIQYSSRSLTETNKYIPQLN
ncbi:unnamed protein product [Lepeophtheirus salmonis]|uniref:(salmon louse) hypothetical protein n=1 Tax=Lepeophtheirus salmonis TaxID=72036 RepID=A0A7R8CNE2_LEPSM|nr:unnamed protein product [Lepeophtheirus salmonis]CAF2874538.1 unnamed protein product [Lepeophtheirus salmonis]